jgi:hypothetical protein
MMILDVADYSDCEVESYGIGTDRISEYAWVEQRHPIMKSNSSNRKLDISMYAHLEDNSLPALLISMNISPEEFEEMRGESEKDPETIALRERRERFKNGTPTPEDLAWLAEGEKHDPNLLTSYHIFL